MVKGTLSVRLLFIQLGSFGAAAWRGAEVQIISGRRLRWYMVDEDPMGKVAVEFDADVRYRNAITIKADHEKDEISKLNDYCVIRIPYWVQLTTETLLHYFNLNATIIQDVPIWFITTKTFPGIIL